MARQILEIINENPVNPVKLHELTAKMNTVDIADAFELLDGEKIVQIFRLLPKDLAADVFSYITLEKQKVIVETLTDTEVGKIVDDLFVDDAVDLIEEMPANVVKRILQNVSEDKRRIINQLLQYPEDSAGSIMTVEYVALREDATVREAFDAIRATGVDKETIYTCYVLRRDKLLVGVVTAKKLMLSAPYERVGDIMDRNPVFAHTTDDQEMIAGLFKKYGFLSVPVVDREQRLVGIVTVDDIIQVIEEEHTEDIEQMAALSPSEEPYLQTTIVKLAMNRIPWLLVLMLSATVTGSIITRFEDSLAVLPVLVAFIPMLMDTGGNAGAQVSTLIIRGMALGEIRLGDFAKIVWREVRVGMICGAVLGAVNFVRVYLMNDRNAMLALTVTFALLMTVIVAKTVGCLFPIIAKKLKVDPAVVVSPFITTFVDAVSLIVFFSIARAILHI